MEVLLQAVASWRPARHAPPTHPPSGCSAPPAGPLAAPLTAPHCLQVRQRCTSAVHGVVCSLNLAATCPPPCCRRRCLEAGGAHQSPTGT